MDTLMFFKCFSFNTVKLLRYVSVTDHMVLGFEIVFFLFVIYYLVEEILEIKKVRFRGAVNIQNIIFGHLHQATYFTLFVTR